eukprot:6212141-Pleurochrysis_carterae.AAC.4
MYKPLRKNSRSPQHVHAKAGWACGTAQRAASRRGTPKELRLRLMEAAELSGPGHDADDSCDSRKSHHPARREESGRRSPRAETSAARETTTSTRSQQRSIRWQRISIRRQRIRSGGNSFVQAATVLDQASPRALVDTLPVVTLTAEKDTAALCSSSVGLDPDVLTGSALCIAA